MSYKAADGSMQGYKQEFASGFGHAQGKRYKTQSHCLSRGGEGGGGDKTDKASSEHVQTSFRPRFDFDLLGIQDTQKLIWLDLTSSRKDKTRGPRAQLVCEPSGYGFFLP